RIKGQFDDALDDYRRAREITASIYGEEHPNTAIYMNNLGVLYYYKGDYNKALEYYYGALVIDKKFYGSEHGNVSIRYNNIGAVYFLQGKYTEALENYTAALKIDEKFYGKEHIGIATDLNNIGLVYYSNEDYKEALRYYLLSLDIQMKTYIDEHPDNAVEYGNIALTYFKLKDYEKTEEYLNKAVKIKNRFFGKDHPETAKLYKHLGNLFREKKEFTTALEYYARAVRIEMKYYGEIFSGIADSFGNIGKIYYHQKDFVQARGYFTSAVNIIEKIRAQGGFSARDKAVYFEKMIESYGYLISTHTLLKEKEEALFILESSRARALLDEVSMNAIFTSRDIAKKLRDGLKKKKREITAYNEIILKARLMGDSTVEHEAELHRVQKEYNEYLTEIFRKYPKYKKLTESKVINLKTLRKVLKEGESVVNYFFPPGGCGTPLAFIIDKKGIELIELADENYRIFVDTYNHILKQPLHPDTEYFERDKSILSTRSGIFDSQDNPDKKNKKKKNSANQSIKYEDARTELNNRLFQSIIEPVLNKTTADKLVIIPSGPLNF
ncbi:MAG: tetratricopeptide repeat protein, partial [Actinomycetia bacterium]|nr:tetratricopeptide repeat protein [Actinomycetes bacterium]